jgi:hypothetical protein
MFPFYNPKMESAGSSETATLYTCIQEVLCSNLGQDISLTEVRLFPQSLQADAGFVFRLYHYWSRDSSVGIVTRPTNQAGARNVLASTAPRPPLGPTQPRF